MQKHDIKQLLERYMQGKCTAEELATLKRWYAEWEPGPFDLSEKELLEDLQDISSRLPKKPGTHRLYYKIAAAAIMLLTLGVVFYATKERDDKNTMPQQVAVSPQKITPGGNKAILTLADGKTIILDSVQKGETLSLSGVEVSKTAEGMLVYKIKEDKNQSKHAFHTMTTPRGGQYQLLLPDGTKVWLNAATQLRFPVDFSGDERKVELTGEAYFEVAHQANKPFKVVTALQEVQVFGTHFNVNAYADQQITKTTLLEGKVRVKKGGEMTWLAPGQQALNTAAAQQIKIKEVADVNEAVAWKNGLFMFDQEDIYTIMKQISRWYDVEVDYKGDMYGKRYSGNISRFKDVSEVLKTMELTGTIRFKIEGRRILVMP